MTEKLHQPTIQELKEFAVFDDFRFEPMDPNHEEAIRAIDSRRSDMIARIKAEEDLWDLTSRRRCGTLEFENWVLNFSIAYEEGVHNVTIQVIDGEWYRGRVAAMDKIFTDEARIEDYYDAKILAKNAGVTAIQKIEIRNKNFDPSKTEDALGKGLDLNTRELMRYLNMIGLKTNGSCGGHWDERKPYLSFEGDQLEAVLGHALKWREEFGFDWLLLPLEHHVASVRLEPPESKSRIDAQRDLDALCNWLSKQVKFPKRTLSIPELGERVRRKVSGIVR